MNTLKKIRTVSAFFFITIITLLENIKSIDPLLQKSSDPSKKQYKLPFSHISVVI